MGFQLNQNVVDTLNLLKNIANKHCLNLNNSIVSLDALVTLIDLGGTNSGTKLKFPVINDNYWLCHLSLLHYLNAKKSLLELLSILAKRYLLLEASEPEIVAEKLLNKLALLPIIPQFQAFKILIKYFKYYLLDLQIPLNHDFLITTVLIQFLQMAESDELLANKVPKPEEFIIDLICSWNSDLFEPNSWNRGFKSIHTSLTGFHKIVTAIDAFVIAMKDYPTSFEFICDVNMFSNNLKDNSPNSDNYGYKLVLTLYLIAKYYALPINRARDVTHLRILHKLPWLTGLNLCITDELLNKHMLYFYQSALYECLPEFFAICEHSIKSDHISVNNLHVDINSQYNDMKIMCKKIYSNGIIVDTNKLHQIYSTEPLIAITASIDHLIEMHIDENNLNENYIGLCQNPINLLQRMDDKSICTLFSLGILQRALKVLLARLNDYLSRGLPQSNDSVSATIKQNLSPQNVYYLQESAITTFLSDIASKHVDDNKCPYCKGLVIKTGIFINEFGLTSISNLCNFEFDGKLLRYYIKTCYYPEKLLEIIMKMLAKKVKSVVQGNVSNIVFFFKAAVTLVFVVDNLKTAGSSEKDNPRKYLFYCAETLNIYFLEALKMALSMNLAYNSFVVSIAGPISQIYYKFPKLASIASVVITHYIPTVPPDQEMLLKALSDLSLSLSAIIQANAATLLQ